MQFDAYCNVMKTRGIGEFFFKYTGKNYFIGIEQRVYMEPYLFYQISGTDIVYQEFNDFDTMLAAPIFDGKTLEEIWLDIQIIEIDGVCEAEYVAEECSYDYIKWKEERGVLQWAHYKSVLESSFHLIKYRLIGGLILPLLSMLLPILKISNWNIVLLFGGCSIIALLVYIIYLARNRIAFHYHITTTRIVVYNGLECETIYANIKKFKLKKSITKKGYGTIKIYVKKGLSLNYCIYDIPNAEEVYDLIENNRKEK